MKYFAFISYRHCKPDATVSRLLLKSLESYRVPKELRKPPGRKKLGKGFRDLEELPIDASLTGQIEAALDQSEFLMAVCSPKATESRFIREEIAYFKKHHDPSKCLAVLVGGEPSSDRPEEQPFPEGLVEGGADGPMQEPLAADVRARTAWGRRRKLGKARLKLVAAILGCDYDRLVEREKARRTRRLLWIATAGAVFLALVGSVILYYYHQAEASRQDRQDSLSALMYRYANENLDTDPSGALCYDVEAILAKPRDDFFATQQASALLQSHVWPYCRAWVRGRVVGGMLMAHRGGPEAIPQDALRISQSLDLDRVLAVSADGGHILLGGADTCRVCAPTGESRKEIPAGYAFLRASVDGSAWIFFGGENIGVYRMADGLWGEVAVPALEHNGLNAEVVAGGQQLFVRSASRVLRYDWDATARRYAHTASLDTGEVFLEQAIPYSDSLWMDAKGRLLFIGNGNRIYLLKARNFETVASIRQDNYTVSGIHVNPGGTRFAIAYGATHRFSPTYNGNGRIELYSSLDGTLLDTTRGGRENGVKGLCFTPDGGALTAWYYNGDVRVYDVSGDALRECCCPVLLPEEPVAAALLNGKTLLAVERERGTVDLYGMLAPASGKVAQAEGAEILSLSPRDGGYAAVGADRITFFDADWSRKRVVYQGEDGYEALREELTAHKARQPAPRLEKARFEYEGGARAVVDSLRISLYDASGALARQASPWNDFAALGTISDAVFSGDGKRLYVVGSDPESFVAAYWVDGEKLERVYLDRPRQYAPQYLWINRDGSRLAVSCAEGRVLVYRCDGQISRAAALRTADQFRVNQLEFDPDSRLMALSLNMPLAKEDRLADFIDGAVELWDMDTGLMAYHSLAKDRECEAMLFDGDQFLFATGTDIRRLYLARAPMSPARAEALRLLSGYRLGQGMDPERAPSREVAGPLAELEDEWNRMYTLNGSLEEGENTR